MSRWNFSARLDQLARKQDPTLFSEKLLYLSFLLPRKTIPLDGGYPLLRDFGPAR